MAEPGRHCARCGDSFGPEVLFCPRDGQPLTSRRTEVGEDPYLGLVVDGLRLDQLVGIGAMGRVYRARETSIDRDVAVKILHRELVRNPVLVSRFEREARAAARLAHPNVVTVHRSGTLPALGADVGGEAFMVLEYLDGISLRSALAAAGGALPLPRALHVVLQICDAVGEAHARGIVHRDLKPDNVMLVHRGDDADFVKVLDFGVARLDESDRELFTQAGAVLGTARYISPEGASGEPVGAPGDVYSIGTILFECLAGVTPFDGDSPVAILVKQTTETAPDVRSIPRGSYVPAPLAALIAQTLSKDPGARRRDARELGRALVAAAHESGLSPEDLLPRSTLLGTRPALRLASLERTKAMPLGSSPSVSGPRGTALVEPESAPARAKASPATEPAAERSTGPVTPEPVPERSKPSATPVPLSRPTNAGPSQPGVRARASTVDATLSEGSEGHWDSLPPERPSPADQRRLAVRRGTLIAACFAAGAAVALLAANGLGAFDEPEPGPSSYVLRARAALARGDILTPKNENVKDITDTALGVWPKHAELLSTRTEAAARLCKEASALPPERRERAVELLSAALELNPDDQEARRVLNSLSAPRVEAPPPSATPSAPRKPVAKPEKRAAAPESAPSAEPAVPTPSPSAETPNVNVGTEPAPSGRWL